MIESFEPKKRDAFVIKVKIGDDTDNRREEVEAILRRYRVDFVLHPPPTRRSATTWKCRWNCDRDRVTNAILKLDPDGARGGGVGRKENQAK